MSIEFRFISGTSPKYDYSLSVPAGGGKGVSRIEAPALIREFYECSSTEMKEKYSSASLADIPDKRVLEMLATDLGELGGGTKMAWVNSWQSGSAKDMVISIEEDKSGQIVEHPNTSDEFPVATQWEKRSQ